MDTEDEQLDSTSHQSASQEKSNEQELEVEFAIVE